MEGLMDDRLIEDVADLIEDLIGGAMPADLATEDIILGLAYLAARKAEGCSNPEHILIGAKQLFDDVIDGLI
jgi:hypothetical protein